MMDHSRSGRQILTVKHDLKDNKGWTPHARVCERPHSLGNIHLLWILFHFSIKLHAFRRVRVSDSDIEDKSATFAVSSILFKATLHSSLHHFVRCTVVDNSLPVDVLLGAPGKHASLYYIKTNSADTCGQIKINTASSVGPVLTLDDKSHLKCLCVTWFYYVEKNRRGTDLKPRWPENELPGSRT